MKLRSKLLTLIACVSCSVGVCAKSSFPSTFSLTDAKIQAAVDKARIKNKLPAIQVSISLPGEYTTRDFVSGTTKLNGKEKVMTGNLFQIGSITKSFVSAIILQLEAEGKLSINDPISKHINFSRHPTWPSIWKRVTIKQLLNMTSGIYDYFSNQNQTFWNTILAHPKRHWTPSALVDIAAKHPEYFPPGKGWKYSNTDYILAGMIIKNVTGKTVTQNMNDRLLGATHLNLLNTYYTDSNYSENVMSHTVHGYRGIPGSLLQRDVSSPNVSWGGSAGGMLSNTRDIVRWARALFSGRVLKSQQLREMKSLVCWDESNSHCTLGQPTTRHVGGYGLGLVEMYMKPLGLDHVWTYEGGSPGYYFMYSWIPSYNTVVCVTGNSVITSKYPSQLSIKIFNILHNSHAWKNYRQALRKLD